MDYFIVSLAGLARGIHRRWPRATARQHRPPISSVVAQQSAATRRGLAQRGQWQSRVGARRLRRGFAMPAVLYSWRRQLAAAVAADRMQP
jgi:hypothetical protein